MFPLDPALTREIALTYQRDVAYLDLMNSLPYPSINERIKGVNKGLTDLRGGTKSFSTGFMQMASSMAILGLLGDENNKALETLRNAILVNVALLNAYSAVRSMATAMTSIQTAIAAAETGAHVAMGPVGWDKIALAGVAVGSFYAGMQLGSGSWDIPNFDISSPMSRRHALNVMKNAQG